MHTVQFLLIRCAGLMAMCLCFGCAHYEFDIVQPTVDGHVGRHSDTHISIDPVVYRMRSIDGRLVIWIDNPKAESIVLLGHKSVAIDEWGVAHPLQEQTIAPGSYIKLTIPPQRPPGESSAPNSTNGPFPANDQPGYIPPSGYGQASPQASDSLRYWDWNDESEIQMNLVFQRNNKTFTQTFLVRRVRMHLFGSGG
jgi:hypothetical protein